MNDAAKGPGRRRWPWLSGGTGACLTPPADQMLKVVVLDTQIITGGLAASAGDGPGLTTVFCSKSVVEAFVTEGQSRGTSLSVDELKYFGHRTPETGIAHCLLH